MTAIISKSYIKHSYTVTD